jgi:hypothetical protein
MSVRRSLARRDCTEPARGTHPASSAPNMAQRARIASAREASSTISRGSCSGASRAHGPSPTCLPRAAQRLSPRLAAGRPDAPGAHQPAVRARAAVRSPRCGARASKHSTHEAGGFNHRTRVLVRLLSRLQRLLPKLHRRGPRMLVRPRQMLSTHARGCARAHAPAPPRRSQSQRLDATAPASRTA